MPAAPAPVLIVSSTFWPLRSTTLTLVSGLVLVLSAGSICVEAATRASDSSGVMATEVGGPTTLPGTLLTVPRTFTGDWPRSRMVIESGVGLSALLVTPFTCWTLWSFDDTAICAQAGAAASPSATQTPDMAMFRMASSWPAHLIGALAEGSLEHAPCRWNHPPTLLRSYGGLALRTSAGAEEGQTMPSACL